tara:strand:+ start:7341 stop:8159 length:819 start_codon:yes stop_codon:yes gene_type:complete
MEQTPTLSLIQPRPSPKMERIYAALEQGYPKAKINEHNTDMFVLWGLIGNNTEYMMKDKYIFCDMPYHGRYDPNNEDWDNTYWRWCFNGLHDNRKLNVPSDRFEKWGHDIEFFEYVDYHDKIVICPSSETMTQYMHGKSVDKWIFDVTKALKCHTNRPIEVRKKPRGNGTSGPNVAGINQISMDLADAHAVVVSGSIVAIDALKIGVPVFSTHRCAPSAWCTNRDFSKINKPEYFNREELFFNLAYKQYSIKEMREGICYENSNRWLLSKSQ